MVEFSLCIAGRVAKVFANFETTRKYCAEYLSDEQPEMRICIDLDDIALERKRSAKAGEDISDAYLETLVLQRKLSQALMECDTLLFHGSVIALDGEGFLFTAKSGTGKSTHTRIWREVFHDRTVMINDDKPFIRIDKNGVWVYGSPWNGKHRLGTNTFVKLKAICLLERGEENKINPLSAKDFLPILLSQTLRPDNRSGFPKYLELIDRLSAEIEFYHLKCNMEREAAVVAYEGMTGKGR